MNPEYGRLRTFFRFTTLGTFAFMTRQSPFKCVHRQIAAGLGEVRESYWDLSIAGTVHSGLSDPYMTILRDEWLSTDGRLANNKAPNLFMSRNGWDGILSSSLAAFDRTITICIYEPKTKINSSGGNIRSYLDISSAFDSSFLQKTLIWY